MRLREALQRYGGAYNRTGRIHIRVEVCAVVDKDGPGSGYRVFQLDGLGRQLNGDLFQDRQIEKIEAFLAQPHNDPPTAAQDQDAWTET